ncbi:hypothetical protein ACFFQF_32575 [Haladaptatus pallidirubidus]|uniref:Uncharacterized protein n=1 Tax=Haladaptatus pallidirubidus TaxID=1008152 RepID=A0AAV3UQ52_9EURY|nr:hypothetical protein [Haladaptatus pallidirubidus]
MYNDGCSIDVKTRNSNGVSNRDEECEDKVKIKRTTFKTGSVLTGELERNCTRQLYSNMDIKRWIANGLFVFIVITILVYIWAANPAAKYTVVLIIAGVVCTILLVDREKVKLDLPGDTGIEIIDNIRGKETKSAFQQIKEIAEEESIRTARLLEAVRTRNNSYRDIDELANIIEQGIKVEDTDPFTWLLSEVRNDLYVKDYKDEFPDSRMKVVQFEGDVIHVKSENRVQYLNEGMKFSVQLKQRSASGESLEKVDHPIGVAEIELVSHRTTKMRMVSWVSPLDDPQVQEVRSNNLKGKEIFADIVIRDEVENANRSQIEETKKELEELVYNNDY